MKNKVQIFVLFTILTGILFLSCQPKAPIAEGWDLVPQILARIIPPQFPDRDFNITDYGAVGDSTTLCTEAIQKAIDECNSQGGGRVVVPAGKFLTGAIRLKSNVNLYVDKEATLLFSTKLKDYLPLVHSRYEGSELMNISALIYADEQENIALTGEGILDGQASRETWWGLGRLGRPVQVPGRPARNWPAVDETILEGMPPVNPERADLRGMNEKQIPVEERIFGQGHYLRVNFVQPFKCKNVLIEGVTIKRSPMWELHPLLCTNVTVRNVKTITHGPNNDGCDPESCKDVLIEGCVFDTGDDCIAIKSGRNDDGRRIGVPCENLIIRNCIMKDGHAGVAIGSEISGDCRNVFVEDCIMDSPNLERALRIKSNSLRGGIVENIYFRNVKVGEVADAVVRVYFYYMEGDAGTHKPMVRNVHVENVTSEKSRYGLLLKGYSYSPVTDIYLKDCQFNNCRDDNNVLNVENIHLENVTINGKMYNETLDHKVPENVESAAKAELGERVISDVNEIELDGKKIYEFVTRQRFERDTIKVALDGSIL